MGSGSWTWSNDLKRGKIEQKQTKSIIQREKHAPHDVHIIVDNLGNICEDHRVLLDDLPEDRAALLTADAVF